jgi:ribosomal protein S18 acetylase RimI-like enzyme
VTDTKATFSFASLDPRAHDRDLFCCGRDTLDRYLKTQAIQDAKRGYSACFVAATAEGRIAGYFTLTAYAVSIEDLPQGSRKGLPSRAPVPAALLGRLAVDKEFQKMGLGAALLADALDRSANSPTAAHALVVAALDDEAAGFYRHFGFLSYSSSPNHFFLPLAPFRKQ